MEHGAKMTHPYKESTPLEIAIVNASKNPKFAAVKDLFIDQATDMEAVGGPTALGARMEAAAGNGSRSAKRQKRS